MLPATIEGAASTGWRMPRLVYSEPTPITKALEALSDSGAAAVAGVAASSAAVGCVFVPVVAFAAGAVVPFAVFLRR